MERVGVHHAFVSSSHARGTASADGDDLQEGCTEVARRERDVLRRPD